MLATVTILADYRTRQRRLLQPLVAPRLAAALVAQAAEWTLLGLAVYAGAVAGYAEGLQAVLNPPPAGGR